MLSENIKSIRKSKGLSQEALAARLNVVRQTVSKWEQNLSVPDAEMLISLSEVLETPVSVLLGENVEEKKEDSIAILSRKLEAINEQLASQRKTKRKMLSALFILILVFTLITASVLIIFKSPYLGWSYGDPEIAVLGTAFHVFEYVFVRIAPILTICSVTGIMLIGRKSKI